MVTSVASGSQFYRLPPDKENTVSKDVCIHSTDMYETLTGIGFHCYRITSQVYI